jgi:hypothetical protein
MRYAGKPPPAAWQDGGVLGAMGAVLETGDPLVVTHGFVLNHRRETRAPGFRVGLLVTIVPGHGGAACDA